MVMGALSKAFKYLATRFGAKGLPWAAFVISLGIGYITVFSQHYASYLAGEPNSKISSRLLANECSAALGHCQIKYEISLEKVPLKYPGNSEYSLVLGRVWNSVEVACADRTVIQYGSKNPAVLAKESFNTFHVINQGQLLDCEKEIRITAKYAQGQGKSGFLDGAPKITTKREAEILKGFATFVQQDLKMLNLSFALATLLFSLLIRIVTIDNRSTARINMAISSFILAFVQSGLLELWAPVEGAAIGARWLSTMASCFWMIYSVSYLSNFRSSPFTIVITWALFFVATIALTSSLLTTLLVFAFTVSGASLVISVVQKNISLFLFFVLLILTSLELSGVSLIKSAYIAPTFIAILILSENNQALISLFRINRLLKLNSIARSGKSKRSRKNSAPAVVRLFQRQFGIKRVTILNISDSPAIELQRFSSKRTSPQKEAVSELPPIFAHVISTGNQLIDVSSDSALLSDIRRGERYENPISQKFTAVPLKSGNQTIGAIALTEYNPAQFATSLNRSSFVFCLDILKSILVEHLLTLPKTETLKKLEELTNQLKNYATTESETAESLIIGFARILNQAFGWRVMAASYCASDYLLKPLEFFSFDPSVKEQVVAGKIYAAKSNLQGPIALAVHEKKPVIVPNTRWLDGVVHSNTVKFFELHQTKTAAFLPILGADGNTLGVYWIEGVKNSEISYADIALFSAFLATLGEKLRLMLSNSKLRLTNQSLGQFVPQHLVEDYLAGLDVKETDFGFLMMFDLKGSTRLAHVLGTDIFHREVEVLKFAMVGAILPKNWVLRQFVWDGMEFTRSCDPANSDRLSIEDLFLEISPVFSKWKSELLRKFGYLPEISETSFRLCFSFGDITRGIVTEGLTRKWSFTGSAIATVSKVEQAAKVLQGVVFCDKSVIGKCKDNWTLVYTTSQGLEIYSTINMENSELRNVA